MQTRKVILGTLTVAVLAAVGFALSKPGLRENSTSSHIPSPLPTAVSDGNVSMENVGDIWYAYPSGPAPEPETLAETADVVFRGIVSKTLPEGDVSAVAEPYMDGTQHWDRGVYGESELLVSNNWKGVAQNPEKIRYLKRFNDPGDGRTFETPLDTYSLPFGMEVYVFVEEEHWLGAQAPLGVGGGVWVVQDAQVQMQNVDHITYSVADFEAGIVAGA